MFKRKKTVTAVDLSDSKACGVIAEVRNEQIEIIASHLIEGGGLKKGLVVDIGVTAGILKNLLKELKKGAKGSSDSIYINVSGSHLDTGNCHGAVMISNNRGVVLKKDVRSVISSAHVHGIALDRMPLHTLVRDYIVDEHRGIINPLKMHARKIEVDLLVVTGVSNYIKNLKRSVNQAGYQIKEMVVSSLPPFYSVLEEEERKSGVVLIDIGAGLMEIAFFHEEKLKKLAIILKGGDDITESISKRLKVSVSYAEEIKKRYGCALVSSEEAVEEVVLKDSNGNVKVINKNEISEAVKRSLEEILSKVESKLEELDCLQNAPCGIVLTGGTALLDSMIEVAQKTFVLPVRLGSPRGFQISKALNSPIWSNCLGLAKYALIKETASPQTDARLKPLAFIKEKTADLFSDYF